MPDKNRLEILEQKINRLCGIILAAKNYMRDDPEAALVKARSSAEAICREIYKQEFSSTPKNENFDKIVNKLKAENRIPRDIFTHLRTVQWYGNLGAHVDLDDEHTNAGSVNACLMALMDVTHWYFEVYLNRTVPSKLEVREEETEQLPISPSADNPIKMLGRFEDAYHSRDINKLKNAISEEFVGNFHGCTTKDDIVNLFRGVFKQLPRLLKPKLTVDIISIVKTYDDKYQGLIDFKADLSMMGVKIFKFDSGLLDCEACPEGKFHIWRITRLEQTA